jgi:tetratricopeptide (TPR) repeat protein
MAGRGAGLTALTWLCLAALGAPAHAQTTAASEAATTGAETPEQRIGDTAYAESKLEQARQAYQAAFDQAPSFALAGNLGAVELELGRAGEAAAHLALALEWFPADGSGEAKARLEHLLARARERASAPPPGPSAASPSPAQRPPDETGPSLGLLVGGTTLGVVALGVGVGLAVLAHERSDLAQSKGAALEQLGQSDPCASYPEACDEIRVKQQSRDRLTAGAAVAFAVAGLSALGTVLYGVLAGGSGQEPAAQAATAVVPTVDLAAHASGVSLTFAGRW